MIKKPTKLVTGAAIALFVLCTSLIGLALDYNALKQDAIKQGFAQYNSQTAKWEWRKVEDVVQTYEISNPQKITLLNDLETNDLPKKVDNKQSKKK
jgi:hypothetical protein